MTLKISTEPSRITWHVSSGEVVDPASGLKEAQHLASVAAQRVWEELYVSKKPAVEEAFKISLGANTQHRAPGLDIVREPALKLWIQYVEAERRSAYRTVLEVSTPNQIQSKIQKVTGGLIARLTARSFTITGSGGKNSRKGEERNRSQAGTTTSCWADVWISTQYHLAGLKEQLEVERRQRQQAVEHAEQFNRLSWAKVEETELLRVRGLWGPSEESRVLTKWMLDMTEGPCRMRKKLTPNPNFYALYPYRPELELAENKSLRYKVAVSLDAKEHFHSFVSNNWRRSLLPSATVQQTLVTPLVAPSVESGEQDALAITQLDLPQLLRPNKKEPSMADIDEDAELLVSVGTDNGPATATQQQQQPLDWQNLVRLLEENKKSGPSVPLRPRPGAGNCGRPSPLWQGAPLRRRRVYPDTVARDS